MIIVGRQAELPQVVGARHAVGGFPHSLHCDEKQANQDGNDGDYDEQLDERVTRSRPEG
jgi:hypothetical protein